MQHTASERLGLPRVPTRLRAEFEGPPPTRTAIYAAAVNGRIPAIWDVDAGTSLRPTYLRSRRHSA